MELKQVICDGVGSHLSKEKCEDLMSFVSSHLSCSNINQYVVKSINMY